MIFVREVDFVIHLFIAIIQIPSTECFFVGFYEPFYNAGNVFHGINCIIQISLTVLLESFSLDYPLKIRKVGSISYVERRRRSYDRSISKNMVRTFFDMTICGRSIYAEVMARWYFPKICS